MLPVDETSSFVGYCCREFSWKLHRIIRSAPPRSGFWLSWVGQQVFFVQLVQRRFFRQQKMIVQDSVLVQKSENHWGIFCFLYIYYSIYSTSILKASHWVIFCFLFKILFTVHALNSELDSSKCVISFLYGEKNEAQEWISVTIEGLPVLEVV